MKKYFICISITRPDKNPMFFNNVIKEHPFIWLPKQPPMFEHKLDIISYQEISDEEFELFIKSKSNYGN